MTEVVDVQQHREIRHSLLLGVSVAALLLVTGGASQASGTFLSSSDKPLLWIEFGGDVEDISPQTDKWMPPALGNLSGSGAPARKDPAFAFGMEGKVAYHLENSGWLVQAQLRYGRSQRNQSFHTQTNQYTALGFVRAYSTTSRHTENHMILDFQVGKEAGIGLLGREGRSAIDIGVRFAQFAAGGDDFVSSKPQYSGFTRQQLFFRTAHIKRRMSAIGPSLSWDASIPIVSLGYSTVNVDWAALGAILFGRQKVIGDFKTESFSFAYGTNTQLTVTSHAVRSKAVVIPDVAVMAGISYRLPAAKLSIGYRAETFFNGFDGGITYSHSIRRGFYGPFAKISVGLGG